MPLPFLLADKKIKLTNDRLIVFNFIQKASKPIDAGTIIKANKNINRATIFRILNYLTEKEVLRKIDFSDGKARYEVLVDDHHHFICQRCGKINKIEYCTVSEMEEKLKEKGYLIKKHSLEFFGLCPNCIN